MHKLIRIGLVLLGTSILSLNALAGGDADAGKAKAAMCAGCHAADGNSLVAANPKLIGQNEKYIAKQLTDFKSGDRKSPVMAGMAALAPR